MRTADPRFSHDLAPLVARRRDARPASAAGATRAARAPPLAAGHRREFGQLALAALLGGADALLAAGAPRRDLLVHIPGRGHDGWSALQLPARLDHAFVEVLEVFAHRAFRP